MSHAPLQRAGSTCAARGTTTTQHLEEGEEVQGAGEDSQGKGSGGTGGGGDGDEEEEEKDDKEIVRTA
eukprot:2672101-Pyramimonas_sp.AAC.2